MLGTIVGIVEIEGIEFELERAVRRGVRKETLGADHSFEKIWLGRGVER